MPTTNKTNLTKQALATGIGTTTEGEMGMRKKTETMERNIKTEKNKKGTITKKKTDGMKGNKKIEIIIIIDNHKQVNG